MLAQREVISYGCFTDKEGNQSQAREEILSEKNAAISEIRGQVASLSIEIAEKIMRSELSEEKKQKALIDNLLDEVKLN